MPSTHTTEQSTKSVPEIPRVKMQWLIAIATGDGIAFVLFAVAGRASHHDSQHGPVLGALLVAAPFLVGWYLAAFSTGAYSASAFFSRRQSTKHIFWTLLLGDSIGLTLRSVGENHITPLPFIVVTFVTTSMLIIGWRYLVFLLQRQRVYETIVKIR